MLPGVDSKTRLPRIDPESCSPLSSSEYVYGFGYGFGLGRNYANDTLCVGDGLGELESTSCETG